MMPSPRLRRVAASLGGSAVAIGLGTLMFGPWGLAVTTVLAILAIAWRHDNQVGACFPLVLLGMIVVTVLVLLITLLAMIQAR